MKYILKVFKIILMIASTYALLMTQPSYAQKVYSLFAEQTPERLLADQLEQKTGGNLRLKTHAFTGKVRFMGTDRLNVLPQASIQDDIPVPEAVA